ncbi:hypothetical protein DUNSADRAFT_17395 [Dunaliella salina]|uniref:4Fe-4S ferredoxin-type domain-containing protein n=1 Tax=Dunaliella salina TaxID=3046 RepID=A0ABQ7G1W7_DUNSA|nr:hypothetical protein DUNSADRAFT_17395 [Dunaliella salina]|eukprot:KAF5828580.1 hypothetical protein DUNSADRAFT_17395 [Dunaliella salina]
MSSGILLNGPVQGSPVQGEPRVLDGATLAGGKRDASNLCQRCSPCTEPCPASAFPAELFAAAALSTSITFESPPERDSTSKQGQRQELCKINQLLKVVRPHVQETTIKEAQPGSKIADNSTRSPLARARSVTVIQVWVVWVGLSAQVHDFFWCKLVDGQLKVVVVPPALLDVDGVLSSKLPVGWGASRGQQNFSTARESVFDAAPGRWADVGYGAKERKQRVQLWQDTHMPFATTATTRSSGEW